MTRNLKALGLALVAVFAMSAIAAQAASAHEFTSESDPTYLTGEQVGNHVFSANGIEVECETAVFTGTQSGLEADTVNMTPSYSGHCTLATVEVEVTNNSCEYKFESDTEGGSAPVDLVCGENAEGIVISGPACNIAIGDAGGANQGLSGVTYANEGGDVDVEASVSGINYTSSGFICALLGIPSEGNNGTYDGLTTVEGFSDESLETSTNIEVD